MRKPAKLVAAASSVAVLLGAMALSPSIAVADEAMVAEGKKIAEDRKKGNCFACHDYKDASLAGNVGPPLVAMKARFPEKAKLRAQIWDATVANPNSIMIPFGRHRVLTEEQIDQVVEYIYTL